MMTRSSSSNLADSASPNSTTANCRESAAVSRSLFSVRFTTLSFDDARWFASLAKVTSDGMSVNISLCAPPGGDCGAFELEARGA
jgi:hypothetical protein